LTMNEDDDGNEMDFTEAGMEEPKASDNQAADNTTNKLLGRLDSRRQRNKRSKNIESQPRAKRKKQKQRRRRSLTVDIVKKEASSLLSEYKAPNTGSSSNKAVSLSSTAPPRVGNVWIDAYRNIL
jgi:hypothetical protein